MFADPTFWVAVAFIIFVALAIKPLGVHRQMFAALDKRGARIGKEIEEAEALREEAQKLLADYKRKQRDAVKEAEEIVAHAKAEAGRLREQAQKDLEASLQRREQAAMEKIAQAEAQALQEIRNQAVDVALAATARLISDNLDQAKAASLVDEAIGDLSGKLN
jgi:F-type H+-transporting ATPase subunit b